MGAKLNKQNLLATFSGGKTSGYMAKRLKNEYSDKYNILFCFANTGLEHEKTLEFVHKVDIELELNLVWLEAVVHHGSNVASTHKVVNFKTASRSSEPFEEVIKKYGIPNKAYPHCNREMKLNPIHSFAKEYFNGEKYKTAIGIRADEQRRVSKSAEKAHSDGIVYPLVDWFPSDKMDVNDFWEDMPFNLEIEEHYGNCVTCWKKSDRKLWTVLFENPRYFDFFRRMEKEHAFSGHNDGIRERRFFRRHRTVRDLEEESKEIDFQLFKESKEKQLRLFGFNIDENSGCSESCEMYETE